MTEFSQVLCCRGSRRGFTLTQSGLIAFRQKMRHDTVQGRSLTDEKAYEENVKLAREISDVLRKNIVQARRVAGASDIPEDATWSMFEHRIFMSQPVSDAFYRNSHNEGY